MTDKIKEFKVVLLGDAAVGKSSLVQRVTDDQFSDSMPSTIGASFVQHKMTVNETPVALQIWDTAGQEKFRALASMYYRGASACLIVLDLTRPETLTNAEYWLNELDQKNKNCGIRFLVGNKADLENQQITEDQIRTLSEERDCKYRLVSAKSGEGVKETFEELGESLLLHAKSVNEDIGDIQDLNFEEKSKNNCC